MQFLIAFANGFGGFQFLFQSRAVFLHIGHQIGNGSDYGDGVETAAKDRGRDLIQNEGFKF